MNVINATYISDYKIEILFEDNKKQIIDFYSAVTKLNTCRKFQDMKKFKKFKVECGNVVWGKNWEMSFTKESLYKNKLIN